MANLLTPLLNPRPVEIAAAVNNLVTEFLWAAIPCDRKSWIDHVATQIEAFNILVHEHMTNLNAKCDVVIEH